MLSSTMLDSQSLRTVNSVVANETISAPQRVGILWHITKNLLAAQSSVSLYEDRPFKLNLPPDPFFHSYQTWLLTKIDNPDLVTQLIEIHLPESALRVTYLADNFGLNRGNLIRLKELNEKFLFRIPDGTEDMIWAVDVRIFMHLYEELASELALITRQEVKPEEIRQLVSQVDTSDFIRKMSAHYESGFLNTVLLRHEKIRVLIQTVELTLPEAEKYFQSLPLLAEEVFIYLAESFIRHFISTLELKGYEALAFEYQLYLILRAEIVYYFANDDTMENLYKLCDTRLSEPSFKDIEESIANAEVSFQGLSFPITGLVREIGQDLMLLLWRLVYIFNTKEAIGSYEDLLEICSAKSEYFKQIGARATGIPRNCVGVEFTQRILQLVWLNFEYNQEEDNWKNRHPAES